MHCATAKNRFYDAKGIYVYWISSNLYKMTFFSRFLGSPLFLVPFHSVIRSRLFTLAFGEPQTSYPFFFFAHLLVAFLSFYEKILNS